MPTTPSSIQQLRDQVIHYFRAVGSGQNMVQCIKEVLFLHENFNPVLIFEKLSKGKQRITSKNWRDYLVGINLHFTEREFKYFMKHNEYKSQVTLNEFLQSIIPYNGDVVREYKQKCTQSIRISEPNKEVDYIFAELIENQFKLFRLLINIRDGISAVASVKDIEKLVKNDLLQDLESNGLCREHRKLQETFEQKEFKLGFSELRKFFKVWVPEKVIVHELCMLNVMRHLKSNDPFSKIIFKKKRKGLNNNDNSAAKRSRSRSADDETPYGSSQKKQQESPYSKHLNYMDPDLKYNQFKDKLLDDFHQTKKQELYRETEKYSNKKESLQGSYKKEQRQPLASNGFSAEKQFSKRPQSSYNENRGSGSKYQQSYNDTQSFKGPQRSFNDAQSILRFLQEIVVKQEKLQRLRKELAKNNDFNLINLYKLMDTKNKGYVTSRDIADFPDAEKAQYLYMVNFYGRQNDKLLFHEFCQIFRPLSRQLNEAIDSRPENKVPDPFKRETRRLISEILKVTAQEHFNLQKMREGMRRTNPKDMFILLDVHNKGYLDSESLLTVFRQRTIYCDDKTLKCFMKLFRKRVDQRITFAEFAKFVEV